MMNKTLESLVFQPVSKDVEKEQVINDLIKFEELAAKIDDFGYKIVESDVSNPFTYTFNDHLVKQLAHDWEFLVSKQTIKYITWTSKIVTNIRRSRSRLRNDDYHMMSFWTDVFQESLFVKDHDSLRDLSAFTYLNFRVYWVEVRRSLAQNVDFFVIYRDGQLLWLTQKYETVLKILDKKADCNFLYPDNSPFSAFSREGQQFGKWLLVGVGIMIFLLLVLLVTVN